MLKLDFLLREVLITQESSTTSESRSEPMGTLSFPDCRSQTLASTVPRENPFGHVPSCCDRALVERALSAHHRFAL